MIYYKNATSYTYTVYGVTFKPGDVFGVPGFIGIFGFIPVHTSDQKPSESVKVESASKAARKRSNTTGGEQLDG